MSLLPAVEDRIFSVLEITRAIKDTLLTAYPAVWVKGEISGFKRHESGHFYFSLKEGREAVLSCVTWRSDVKRLEFDPRDGLEVEALGEITVYEPRGQYQFQIRQMRPAGLGALMLERERLKQLLTAEGMFDPARKRPLPAFPRRIGVVTSPVGAAIRDIVKVLRARWPGIGIVLAPVKVQGSGAAEEIAAAIDRFNRHGGVDTLIVGRGGGSIEDLWAFNEEPLVRAIAGSRIPVISAVGHEVDWTLADLAADVRAATPSNAAELAVPDRAKILGEIESLAARGTRAIGNRLGSLRGLLAEIGRKHGFRRLPEVLSGWQQRIDNAVDRVRIALQSLVRVRRRELERLSASYGLRELPRLVRERHGEATLLRDRLEPALVRLVLDRRQRVLSGIDRLRALSPRLVLERGYCLARAADGTVLRSAETLAPGDRLRLEFARGEADARVESVRPGGTHGG